MQISSMKLFTIERIQKSGIVAESVLNEIIQIAAEWGMNDHLLDWLGPWMHGEYTIIYLSQSWQTELFTKQVSRNILDLMKFSIVQFAVSVKRSKKLLRAKSRLKLNCLAERKINRKSLTRKASSANDKSSSALFF